MRLSEAIMLGSATCKMEPGDWNSCALGCAMNAEGIRQYPDPGGLGRSAESTILWPWIWVGSPGGNSFAETIWLRFDSDVCRGRMSLEQLVDYVRSIEPNCDCNRFNCDCKATQPEVEHEQICAQR